MPAILSYELSKKWLRQFEDEPQCPLTQPQARKGSKQMPTSRARKPPQAPANHRRARRLAGSRAEPGRAVSVRLAIIF